MNARKLPLIYRFIGRRRLAREIDGTAVLFVPEAVPPHTQDSMFLRDVALYRLRAAVGSRAPFASDFARDLDVIETRAAGVEAIDVRNLSGVTASKASLLSWAEFRRAEGAARLSYRGEPLGCASQQDAQRLLAAISLGEGKPYPVTRVTWTGQLFWGGGTDGGSHRMAAVADWCHRTETSIRIGGAVTEASIEARSARVLTAYIVGLLPLTTAYALAATVRQRTGVRALVVGLDVSALYGRANMPEVAVVGLPTGGAIARDVAAFVTSRSDWVDLSNLLNGRA